jgi:uncharacterized protein RhaS with RHS repeats
MFDPSIGRWLSEDPTGFESGDVNLYRFVGNDPTNGTDPSGLKVVRVLNAHATGSVYFMYVPDTEADPEAYVKSKAAEPLLTTIIRPTPAQATLIKAFGGTPDDDQAVAQLLTLAQTNWV